ncbi:hypothetical protein D3C87_1923980 [compost metagenome]
MIVAIDAMPRQKATGVPINNRIAKLPKRTVSAMSQTSVGRAGLASFGSSAPEARRAKRSRVKSVIKIPPVISARKATPPE